MAWVSGPNPIWTGLDFITAGDPINDGGPFEYGGALYVVARDIDRRGSKCYILKSDLTGVTWSLAANLSHSALEDQSFVPETGLIYVLTQDQFVAGLPLSVKIFDCHSDTVTSTVDASSAIPAYNEGSGNSPRVVGCPDGSFAILGDIPGAGTKIYRYASGVWTTVPADSDQCLTVALISDSASTIYLFYAVDLGGGADFALYQNMLDTSNTLGTRNTVAAHFTGNVGPFLEWGPLVCFFGGELFLGVERFAPYGPTVYRSGTLGSISWVDSVEFGPFGADLMATPNLVTDGATLYAVLQAQAVSGFTLTEDQMRVSTYQGGDVWSTPATLVDFLVHPPLYTPVPDNNANHFPSTHLLSNGNFAMFSDFYIDPGASCTGFVSIFAPEGGPSVTGIFGNVWMDSITQHPGNCFGD